MPDELRNQTPDETADRRAVRRRRLEEMAMAQQIAQQPPPTVGGSSLESLNKLDDRSLDWFELQESLRTFERALSPLNELERLGLMTPQDTRVYMRKAISRLSAALDQFIERSDLAPRVENV